MSTASQGKLVGSRSAAFRKTSTSKPDEWRDRSGKDVGAARNYAHEKAAVAKAMEARRKRDFDAEKRTKEAEQRAKETLKMAKESAEAPGTAARVKVKNVARPDDAVPTSEKSKLSKQAEIKTKIIDEDLPMPKTDFGLPHSLISATRSILEKKTQVDLEPETDDRDDDDSDDKVKKESKHTTPKTDKEKKLAALAHPKDKITHKDVLVGRGVLKKEETEVDIDSLTEEQLEEVLKKSQPAGEWIKDFVHSKDPKFAGKSKKERMRMALGAYYAKQRNEEVELTAEELERIEAIAAQLDESEMTVDKLKKQGWKKTRSSDNGWVHHYSHPDKDHGYDVHYGPAPDTVKRIMKTDKMNEEKKPTMVSSPIRGANQDQSGFGVKKSVADYTISDSKKVKEEVDLDEARGRPKKSGDAPEGDDTHKHPIQQLNKIAASIQGNEPHFEHKDGSKTKLTKQVAKHVSSIYGGLRTSQEKDDFAKGLYASRDSMMSTIKKHI